MGSVPQVLVWKENHLHMFSNGKKSTAANGSMFCHETKASKWMGLLYISQSSLDWMIYGVNLKHRWKMASHRIQFKNLSSCKKLCCVSKDIFPKIVLSTWLVVSTPLNNISHNGNVPQIGVKIKNIWNHHLDHFSSAALETPPPVWAKIQSCSQAYWPLDCHWLHDRKDPGEKSMIGRVQWLICFALIWFDLVSRLVHWLDCFNIRSTLHVQKSHC